MATGSRPRLGPTAATATLALALALAACSAEPPSPPERPNLLLVTIDTLRADRLAAWGHGAPTSPGLDRLAASGVRFSHALSAGSCTAPSHASILTGLYPSFHSVGAYNGHHPLAGRELTLAEILADAGYDTAAVVSNPVLARRLGLDQGFAIYDDRLDGVEANRDLPQQDAATAVAKAEALLATLEPPWFLWLHLQDPHGPYTPPPDAPDPSAASGGPVARLPVGDDNSGYRSIPLYQRLGDERRAAVYAHAYEREIAFADRELAGLFERLEAEGVLDGALLAVTADHGEAVGEDDFWFAHGHSVGLDQVHVPLILAGRMAGRGLTPGSVVDTPVSHAALFATLVEAAGLEVPATREAAGAGSMARPGSLWPLLDDPEAAQAEPVFVDSLNQLGIAAGGWYLRRDRVPSSNRPFWQGANPNTGGFWKPLGTEVRRIAGDTGPGEEPAAALGALLDAYQRRADQAAEREARLRASRPADERPPPLTEEERRRLRALGYAG